MNQTGYGIYHGCLESKTERIFALASLEKVSFSYGNVQLFRIT